MKYYNPFEDCYFVLDIEFNSIELQLIEQAFSGVNCKKYYIKNFNHFLDYVKIINKYNLLQELTKSPSKGGSGYFEINIYFPTEQTDNNLIQNAYFKVTKILDDYIKQENKSFYEKFLSTSIYKKILEMKKNNNSVIELNNVTLDEIYDLEFYGKYYGYYYKINDNNLIIYTTKTKPEYISEKSKEYIIQKLLFKLNSQIYFNLLSGKKEIVDSKYSLMDKHKYHEQEFWIICKKFLNEKNIELTYFIQTDECHGEFDNDYFCIKNINYQLADSKSDLMSKL